MNPRHIQDVPRFLKDVGRPTFQIPSLTAVKSNAEVNKTGFKFPTYNTRRTSRTQKTIAIVKFITKRSVFLNANRRESFLILFVHNLKRSF